jgi:hypothetical protein
MNCLLRSRNELIYLANITSKGDPLSLEQSQSEEEAMQRTTTVSANP